MPSASEPMPPEVWAQVDRFTHLGLHLQARKAGWEPALVVDCWDVIWTGEAPDWAAKLAATGVPGTTWCPVISPGLRARDL